MLNFDSSLVDSYKSNSQKIRIMSESWTGENIFCPNCGNQILHYDNNKPVADFYCNDCKEDYELKSWKTLWNKITDWAYSTMIDRLKSDNNPNFFFLNYKLEDYKIFNFVVIPKHYFTPEIIEKRKPLSENTRRAGWIWCNILLSWIPESGKIFYIKNWIQNDKDNILRQRNKTLFLRDNRNFETKWWLLDTMKCIDTLNKKEFKLQDIYNFENILKTKYPNNNFIKDKLRQQLQILRDKWYLDFIRPWEYKLL